MPHDTSRQAGPGEWFAPKRYGYGSGLPIAWQGWALLAAYVLALAGMALIDGSGMPGGHALALGLVLIATTCLLIIAARHTRGGWKWRWGKD